MSEHEIIRLGHQGDGIADGPVFAPMALPREIMSGTLNGTRLTDTRIEKPSSDRVAPPCRHFKSCGGCQLQHASDAFLANWKVETVQAALAAHGVTLLFEPIAISPPKSRRRATLSARRTKKGAMAGFHAKGSDVIIEVPDCQLLHPDLMVALPVAEALAIIAASRKGEINVAATLCSAGLDVSVSGGKPLDGPLEIELAGLAEKFNLARLSWDGETLVTRMPPMQVFGTAHVVPPPGAFLQATASGEQSLLTDVQDIVSGASKIVDLFAGCGTFSLPLAQNAQVHSVEGDPAMTAALDAGWRKAEGLKQVTTEARDLFRRPLLPDELALFDAAVIDPPRAGGEAQITELAKTQIPIIAYVSCNPVTFARDAAHLVSAGYRVTQIRVVDQFRWSSHVELVAAFHLNSQ